MHYLLNKFLNISVKSSNLQEKIKALNEAGLSVSAVEKFIPPCVGLEPLKITEQIESE